MRTLFASYFISLDGVVDAPQNWHFPYAGAEVMDVVGDATKDVDALLMGRRTFEEWKAFWPGQSGYPLADFINSTRKYVVTGSGADVGWAPSTVLTGDVLAAVADLKARPGGRIAVNGSGTLTRHLLSAGLVDELHLLVHPVVVGNGKHLFENGAAAVGLDLVATRAFANGVVHNVYSRAAATEEGDR
ncbi:dihydrofolate reductase family protein [Phytohabitans houttuyneae]|uniref:Deaminase reductase n=1 Tax=Phytohabitans houttuyneae TaxID=1076126 RepID=A0A6V8KED5_9ACTN|nr:dihydrofolate reductase family protein [Phytohabitans houttuyneae]GFJ83593.1 deaminase reductase [Phytohabitans houttuyneae]